MDNELDKTIKSLQNQMGTTSQIPPGTAVTEKKPDLEPIFNEPYVGPFELPFGIGGDATPFEMKTMDSDAIQRNKEKMDAARINRISKVATDMGGTFEMNNDEVSNIIGFDDLATLGFVDNVDQFKNAMQGIVGEGNYKVIEDKDAAFFQDKYYVSLKKPDGSFTPFTSPTQNTLDYVQKYFPMLGYEVVSDSAAVGTSILTTTALTSLASLIPVAGAVAAPVVAVAGLGYMLYTLNKGAERGRQFIQEQLGLRGEDAEEFGSFVENVKKIVTDPKIGEAFKKLVGKKASISQEEFNQELRGIFGTAISFPLALVDKLKGSLGRLRENFTPESSNIYESAIKAEDFADKKGLVPTILPQRTMDKKISRLASLAEQTSVIIPKVLRSQMQSAVNYLKEFRGNIGAGNFSQFRSAMAGMGTMLKNMKEGKTVVDYEGLGLKLNELEDLFFNLRMTESRGMYKDIFDKIGNSSFNLEKIRSLLVSREVKTTVPVSKQTAGSPIEAGSTPIATGEPRVDSIVADLMNLGALSGKTRVLSGKSVEKAVIQLKKNHPEYAKYLETNDIEIKTPAQLLHGYAVLLGQMSKGVFGKDVGTAANPQLASFTQGLRTALLEEIANPITPKNKPAITGLKELIGSANAFYKKTFEVTETGVQIQSRIAAKTGDEGTTIPEAIGIAPGSGGRKQPVQKTLSNIAFQEDYILKNFKGKNTPIGPMSKIKIAFADIISNKLKGAADVSGVKIDSAADVKKYIESYSPREIQSLGIDKASIFKDLETIAKLESADVASQLALGSRIKNTELKTVFDNIVAKGNELDLTKTVDTMMDIVSKMPKPQQKLEIENMRAGLLDYVFSKQSGVYKEVTEKNSAYSEVGDLIIDPSALNQIITKLDGSGIFNKILTSTDKELLSGMQNYVSVIQTAGADAGSALAGAQIIGNMFTLDPKKFISGMARLSAQGRVAKLFASKAFSDAMTGIGKPQTQSKKLLRYFTGAGAIGNIIAGFTVGTQRSPESDQTNQMMNNSPELDKTIKSLREQTQTLQVQ